MLKFPKKSKTKPKGSRTEAPVQAALNDYLDLKGLYYLRLPDLLFSIIIKELKATHNIYREIKIKNLLKFLKGWPDNMVFFPLHDKYLLACPIECKSATGKSHGKQKVMGRELNYQIPRSPQDAINIVTQCLKDFDKINEILKEKLCKL